MGCLHIWANNTPQSLHKRTTGIKGSRACKEECPRTLQICSKLGRALHRQGSPQQWILVPCKGRWDCLNGYHIQKMVEAILCVTMRGSSTLRTLLFSNLLNVSSFFMFCHVVVAQNFIQSFLLEVYDRRTLYDPYYLLSIILCPYFSSYDVFQWNLFY